MKIGLLGSGSMSQQIGVLCSGFDCDIVVWNHVLRATAPVEMRREAAAWQRDADAVLARVRFTDSLRDLAGSTLVIESIVEDLQVKSRLFGELSAQVGPETIITSNTSSLSIEALSHAVRHPARFHGLHFLSPLQKVRFVEVCAAGITARDRLAATCAILDGWGIAYREVPDHPGFIVNHILMAMLNTSMRLVQERGMAPELVDDAVRLSRIHLRGPLEVADFVGLDTCLRVLNSIHAQTHNPAFKPAELLERLVGNGDLGIKSGAGFYAYDAPDPHPGSPPPKRPRDLSGFC